MGVEGQLLQIVPQQRQVLPKGGGEDLRQQSGGLLALLRQAGQGGGKEHPTPSGILALHDGGGKADSAQGPLQFQGQPGPVQPGGGHAAQELTQQGQGGQLLQAQV